MDDGAKRVKAIAIAKPKDFALLGSLLEICIFTSLMILSAYLRIPVPGTPVPITLQVLVVLLAPFMIGKVNSAISQLSYLTLGVWGLPVFAGGGAGLAFHSASCPT